MTICVQWPRFGPYHLARLAAAAGLLRPRGVHLVGLETAGHDEQYAWRIERGPQSFDRQTLFPGETFEDIAPARLHRAMTAALDRINPDAVGVHSYSLPDARAALSWCRRHRRVAILMYDSNEGDSPRVGWREWIKRCLVRQYDAGLVAGTRQQRYALKLGLPADVLFLGYDVVDNAYFSKRAEAVRRDPSAGRGLPGLQDATPFFLASNRFLLRKNLPLLLRAYAAYRASEACEGRPPWRLVLLGGGPLRGELEAMVREEQIGGVTFAGFRQVDVIPAYYARASAFVHPAETDQWALVVNEAMATGLPVIVSDGAGCVEDLVEHGRNGFRFAPNDEAALTRHLHTLATTADREAMGLRSREIIARWPLERFAESLHRAATAGRARAQRGFDPVARAIVFALRKTARSVRSFHSVEL